MSVSLPRPSAIGSRPAYLDNLFRSSPTAPSPQTPSLHSANSSLSSSSSSYDLRSAYRIPRPLSPFAEEVNDHASIRSKRSIFSSARRFRLGGKLHRRTFPQYGVEEMAPTPEIIRPAPPIQIHAPRTSSLPKLNTNLPPARGVTSYARKPSPAIPQAQAQEVSCHRCYYFAARHCGGWVMGGSNGDACETCLATGFFGEK